MHENTPPRVLIAGIGNIFLGDDGFGSEAVRCLASMHLPPGVSVRDFGIRGLDLAYALLDPYELVIFVDAVSRGEAPGTVYLLEPAPGQTAAQSTLDPHSMEPAHLLAMAQSLGEVTARILIVGCEPQDFGTEFEGRLGLSPPVAAAIPQAIQAVLSLAGSNSKAGSPTGDSSSSRLAPAEPDDAQKLLNTVP